MRHTPWLLSGSLLACAFLVAFTIVKNHSVALASPAPQRVDARGLFGMQFVPKFDERSHQGSWQGSRARGIAMDLDLGVQLSREGLLWRSFEPEAPGVLPNLADFDDAVSRLHQASIGMEAMVTETPFWASTAPHKNASEPNSYKSAPPKGLNASIFSDGSDTPGPSKQLNPANTWAIALNEMVSRYKGRIRYWQMWNEPDYPKGALEEDLNNSDRSWTGSVDAYVRLLKVGYTVVKWRDPNAQVVTGGLGFAPYLEAMLAKGAGAYFDQLDFHAYGWPGSDMALTRFIEVHDAMQAALKRHGLNKGLMCSETGYTALEGAVQADYIAKLYPTALALKMASVMYYSDINPSWKTMGLLDWHTMSQKTPGYWAYKNAAVALAGARAITPINKHDLRGYRFKRPNGTEAMVVWAPDHLKDNPVTTKLALGSQAWQVRDDLGRSHGWASSSATLELTTSPLWLDQDTKRNYAAMRPNPALTRSGWPIERALADTSSENASSPAFAVDTDLDTQWSNGDYKQLDAWLAVELTRPRLVSSLAVKTGPMPAGTWFDVEGSSDGKRYMTLASHKRLLGWQMETLALAHPTRARFVRLNWHNPEAKPVSFNVFEIEVH